MGGEAEDYSNTNKDNKMRIVFFAYKTGEVYERYSCSVALSKKVIMLQIIQREF
jgi:hypothetical protein